MTSQVVQEDWGGVGVVPQQHNAFCAAKLASIDPRLCIAIVEFL